MSRRHVEQIVHVAAYRHLLFRYQAQGDADRVSPRLPSAPEVRRVDNEAKLVAPPPLAVVDLLGHLAAQSLDAVVVHDARRVGPGEVLLPVAADERAAAPSADVSVGAGEGVHERDTEHVHGVAHGHVVDPDRPAQDGQSSHPGPKALGALVLVPREPDREALEQKALQELGRVPLRSAVALLRRGGVDGLVDGAPFLLNLQQGPVGA
mmetsp:Transcript_21954/g.65452  ORF Transcript_21954/g.65452 Transcript_21954/m.65452 type:complete len:208 (+) Transcript_21954:1093-1716(+)